MPPIPAGMAAIWEAFQAISAARPSGMGPSAIPQSEIRAWQDNHGVQLTSWEIETIQQLDAVALQAIAEQQQKAAPT